MNRPERLTATFVKSVYTPGRYSDRGSYGLSLLVKRSASGRLSKSWSQALRHEGLQYRVGLGSFPLVSLAAARDVAFENARAARAGKDVRVKERAVPRFADCLEQAIKVKGADWKNSKTEAQLRAQMEAYVLPRIGKRRIDTITPGDILEILTPLALEKPGVVGKLKTYLSQIFKWSIAQGFRETNPADSAINPALPKLTAKKHFAALPHGEVEAALQTIRDTAAHWSTKAAIELLVLTACRSGEIREATWDEVSLETGVWTIPPQRMKSGREHRVPLSGPALEVLKQAQQRTGGVGLVFPSLRGKPMTDATMSKLLRENNIGAVPHGFRSSFRNWCGESGIDRQVAEACLAHTVGNATETAYLRTDFFTRRRATMGRWAEYIVKSPQAEPM